MIAEIITIGTEILFGKVENENARYLCQELTKVGIDVFYQSVVGDDKEHIANCVKLAMDRSELLVITGGMGPTKDDITRETVLEVYGNPDKVIEMDNHNGTSSGCYFKSGKQQIFLLPGRPIEMREMYKTVLYPILADSMKEAYYSSVVKVCGCDEEAIAKSLEDIVVKEHNVKIVTYVQNREIHIRITAKAKNENEAKKVVKPIVKELKSRLGNSVYTSHEETTLEKSVVDLLLANNLTITTVESCTGGLIAGRLINVPGVSEVYKSGQITYSNKAKRKLVGVKKSTLQKYGAVSKEVVKEMCLGASFFSKADVTVAVSGIAGPDGGTDEKPVGLVYIGCNVCGVVTTKEYHFAGSREKIREMAVAESLILLRQCILEYYSKMTFGDN